MQCVIETHAFAGAAENLGLTDDERHKIVTFVAENPDAGDIIPGTGGARKLRFPFKGKGKRGGIRIVTYFSGDDIPVFLLEIFAKGERIDLTKAERNELRKTLGEMVECYRAANSKKIAELVEKTG